MGLRAMLPNHIPACNNEKLFNWGDRQGSFGTMCLIQLSPSLYRYQHQHQVGITIGIGLRIGVDICNGSVLAFVPRIGISISIGIGIGIGMSIC